MKILIPKFEKATGKSGDSFIGIRVQNGELIFKYPETYRLDLNDDLRKQAMKIIASFSLTRQSSADDPFNSKTGDDYKIPLLSYLWLLNDYLTYHRYENREKHSSKGTKGKIDWRKTLKQNPYIQNYEPYYLNTYVFNRAQREDVIVDVYRHCVIDSIKTIGWIYGVDIDEYLTEFSIPFNKLLFINVLRNELSKTFDDVKRTRLMHMLNVIKGLSEEEILSNEYTRGVDQYEHCYEAMLKNMLSNVDNIKDFYPSANWTLETDKLTRKSSNLRPDIIMINHSNKTAYVLDAKYYRFGTTFNRQDLPDSSSIQKQITYGEYIKKLKLKGYSVYNAFIMPYDMSDQLANKKGFTKTIEYVGMATTPWSDTNSSAVNNRIVAILMDTKFLIDNWNAYNGQMVSELSQLIIDKTKSFQEYNS